MFAKSKGHSIETLILQALIDMDISHEELITILKEKYKYEKMKDNLRNENEKSYGIMRLSIVKSKTQNNNNNKKNKKIKKFFFCISSVLVFSFGFDTSNQSSDLSLFYFWKGQMKIRNALFILLRRFVCFCCHHSLLINFSVKY